MRTVGKRICLARAFAFLCLAGGLAGCGKFEGATEEWDWSQNLLAARSGFRTDIVRDTSERSRLIDAPPEEEFEVTDVGAPVGDLVAYVTPDPGDGKRHPAVLWLHGGFGGIGSYLWEPADKENDQSARAFREMGIVLMCPSRRGENDNPGQFEMFYGEVDDTLSALSRLQSLSYVDPDRIYIAGHSTGGTLTLLAAVASDKFRAAFSFGGAPDLVTVVESGGWGNTPYNIDNAKESVLRSPIYFVGAIRRPTFYFEGADSPYNVDAAKMDKLAQNLGVPFWAYMISGADHFNILDPLTNLIALKILNDTGAKCNIRFTSDEVQRAFANRVR